MLSLFCRLLLTVLLIAGQAGAAETGYRKGKEASHTNECWDMSCDFAWLLLESLRDLFTRNLKYTSPTLTDVVETPGDRNIFSWTPSPEGTLA